VSVALVMTLVVPVVDCTGWAAGGKGQGRTGDCWPRQMGRRRRRWRIEPADDVICDVTRRQTRFVTLQPSVSKCNQFMDVPRIFSPH